MDNLEKCHNFLVKHKYRYTYILQAARRIQSDKRHNLENGVDMLVKLGVVHGRELVGAVDASQQPGQETGLQLLLLHKPLSLSVARKVKDKWK